MQLRHRAGASFPSSAQGEVFTCPTEPPGAHAMPAAAQQLSHEVRALDAPGFVGAGGLSPGSKDNSLHLIANKLWPSHSPSPLTKSTWALPV